MGHIQDRGVVDLLDPGTLPISYLHLGREPWDELLSRSDRHVLEFINIRASAGNPATIQELLTIPGPSRNSLLGSVLGLEFTDVIRVDPRWTTEQWLSARDKKSDQRRDAAWQDAVKEIAFLLLNTVSKRSWNPVGDALEAVTVAAKGQWVYDEDSPAIEDLLPAGQWPTTAHLRLHYLADIGDGWFCRDCGIGLIDVCRDDDTIIDSDGRRVIRPDCTKRLPTRDHRIPQQLNGSNGPDNLDLVCRPCNSAKGAA